MNAKDDAGGDADVDANDGSNINAGANADI